MLEDQERVFTTMRMLNRISSIEDKFCLGEGGYKGQTTFDQIFTPFHSIDVIATLGESLWLRGNIVSACLTDVD